MKRNESVSESVSKVPMEVFPTRFVGIVFVRPKTRSTVLFVEYVWNADFSSRVENSHEGRDALMLIVAIKNASRNARIFPLWPCAMLIVKNWT